MAKWSASEQMRVGDAEELDLASQGEDGSLGKYTTMWVVRVGDEIYVRSYKGRESAWFRGVLRRHAGSIRAGGVEKRVTFEEVPEVETVNDAIDEAYKTKYATMPQQYVEPMYAPLARSATLRISPA